MAVACLVTAADERAVVPNGLVLVGGDRPVSSSVCARGGEVPFTPARTGCGQEGECAPKQRSGRRRWSARGAPLSSSPVALLGLRPFKASLPVPAALVSPPLHRAVRASVSGRRKLLRATKATAPADGTWRNYVKGVAHPTVPTYAVKERYAYLKADTKTGLSRICRNRLCPSGKK